MSLSFLPSYLRNWIDAECNSPEKDDLFDFQATEEKDDWVVINYRKTTNEENKNELDDLLSQYVIVKNHTQENETENNNKISKKDDSTGKRAKRRIYEQNKLRSMECLSIFPRLLWKGLKKIFVQPTECFSVIRQIASVL